MENRIFEIIHFENLFLSEIVREIRMLVMYYTLFYLFGTKSEFFESENF